jgi:hypothetical protein
MTITFSFDNPRELTEIQTFFHNNQAINNDPLANRPPQKFDIDLKGCMIGKFQIDNCFSVDGFLNRDMGESKFEIVTDELKVKCKNTGINIKSN